MSKTVRIVDVYCPSHKQTEFLNDQILDDSLLTDMNMLTRLNMHAALVEDMISQEQLWRVSHYMVRALFLNNIENIEYVSPEEAMDTGVKRELFKNQ